MRPIILFQRIEVPASPQPIPAGRIGPAVRTDAAFFSMPEAMKLDYIFIDTEEDNPGDIVVRPYLRERELWVPDFVLPSTYNNYHGRGTDSPEYGEFRLKEPFLAVRGHAIAIEVENRIPDECTALQVVLQGYGRDSGDEYSLSFDCNLPVGTAAGIRQTFGGRNSYVSGKEDVWITALTWAAKPGNPDLVGTPFGFNPRLISLLVKPSYGTRWSGPGGGGAGGAFVPLSLHSNIRGPSIACMYKPHEGMLLEQNDVFTLEIAPYTPANGTIVHVGMVGASKAP